jgi:hypothetical protein
MSRTDDSERGAHGGAVVAFRATAELVADIAAAAAAEGISRSDVARRAVLRDLVKSESERR